MLFLLLLSSVACLSLAMNKHYKTCFKRAISAPKERVLRLLGWGLMLVSLGMALVQQRGGSMGFQFMQWCCLLSVAIVLQVWLLNRVQQHKTQHGHKANNLKKANTRKKVNNIKEARNSKKTLAKN